MQKELIYKQTITIKAEISKVWDALINPDMTKQYMFGCVPVSDWKIGSRLTWRGSTDGVDYVIGTVLKFEPYSTLAFTTFDPNAGYPDVPENYVSGEYTLTYKNGETTISIVQGDFGKIEDGKKRYEGSVQSWEMTMQILKKLLEEETSIA